MCKIPPWWTVIEQNVPRMPGFLISFIVSHLLLDCEMLRVIQIIYSDCCENSPSKQVLRYLILLFYSKYVKSLEINSRRGMDEWHRCFAYQNHYASTYTGMGVEEEKDRSDSAYKQFLWWLIIRKNKLP